VACSPPLTDESRIALEINDLVNVTRWRKHWLFGEKATENGKTKKGDDNEEKVERVKGWFPRRAAVEMYEDEDDDEFDGNEDGAENKKKLK
jgi:hypothetical protein